MQLPWPREDVTDRRSLDLETEHDTIVDNVTIGNVQHLQPDELTNAERRSAVRHRTTDGPVIFGGRFNCVVDVDSTPSIRVLVNERHDDALVERPVEEVVCVSPTHAQVDGQELALVCNGWKQTHVRKYDGWRIDDSIVTKFRRKKMTENGRGALYTALCESRRAKKCSDCMEAESGYCSVWPTDSNILRDKLS